MFLSEDSDDEEVPSGGGGGGGRSTGSRNRRGRRSRDGGHDADGESGPEARRRRRRAKREPHYLRREMPLLIKRWAGSERLQRLAVAEEELVDALEELLTIRLGNRAEASEAASEEGHSTLDVVPGMGAAGGRQRTEGQAEGEEQRGTGDGEVDGGEEYGKLAEVLVAGLHGTGVEAGRQEHVAAPPAAAGEHGVNEQCAAGVGGESGGKATSCEGAYAAHVGVDCWTETVSQPNGHLPRPDSARGKEGWQQECGAGTEGGLAAAGEGTGVGADPTAAAPEEDVEGVEGAAAVTLEELEARAAAGRAEHREALAAVQWALEDVGRMLLRVFRVANMYSRCVPARLATPGAGTPAVRVRTVHLLQHRAHTSR